MQITRRDLLAYAAAIGVPGSLIDLAFAQAGTPRIRQNITVFEQDAAKVAALRAAIGKMKARSLVNADDPLGYDYWASVHGTDKAKPVNLQNIYGQCDHTRVALSGQPSYIAQHFVSWHRAFLFYFEATLKAAAKEAGIATALELPYWNWYATGTISTIFTTGDASSNPLWHDRANTSVTSSSLARGFFAKKDLVPASLSTWANSFSVPMEFNPHGVVHSVIGYDMGNILTSARDPIFWLHHANIDRLWTSWFNMGGGRSNPPDASPWAQKTFVFDTAGLQKQTAMAVENSEQVLNYRYDDYTPFPGPTPAGPAIAQGPVIQMEGAVTQTSGGAVTHALGIAPNSTTVSSASSLTLGNQSVAVDMKLAPAIQTQLHTFAAQATPPAGITSAWLVLENVEIGPDGQQGGFSFSVKASLPGRAGNSREVTLAELNAFNWPSAAAPDAAHDHGGALQPVTLTIPLKDVLRGLQVASPADLTKGLRVFFQSAHPEKPGNPQYIKIGSISIKTSNSPIQ
jgi:hypothetical protein